MAQLPRTVFDPPCALALAVGLGLLAVPTSALAAPDDDEDLVIDDEDEDYDDPLADEDDEDDADASASGSASASLGGGASASGKAKRKKREKKPKEKDDRPFFQRHVPTNHMLNAGGYLGGFWRANNHGLADRQIGPQPSTDRSNFDIGFRLEYMPIPYIGVGFETGGMPTTSASEGNVRATFYTVRAHVIGSLPYRLTPTLAVGGGLLGVTSKSAAILNGSEAAFHWGPGVKFYVNEWFAVRLDGRHIVTGDSVDPDRDRSHHGELLLGAEVTIRLSRWVGEDWRAQRTDSDGDEVADFYDECPGEYGEDEDGCPVNRDSDHDGIPDRNDRCVHEWGDGADGCPIPDMDGDGILDLDDNCEEKPENYNGFEDEDGCPDELPAEITQFDGVVEGIFFDSAKSSIRRRSRKVLDEVAEVLEKYPSISIAIAGHTDDRGKHESNMELSLDRADAVKKYLVDKGIDASRITTRGVGPDEPIADNKTKKGRSQNRRIEFKIE